MWSNISNILKYVIGLASGPVKMKKRQCAIHMVRVRVFECQLTPPRSLIRTTPAKNPKFSVVLCHGQTERTYCTYCRWSHHILLSSKAMPGIVPHAPYACSEKEQQLCRMQLAFCTPEMLVLPAKTRMYEIEPPLIEIRDQVHKLQDPLVEGTAHCSGYQTRLSERGDTSDRRHMAKSQVHLSRVRYRWRALIVNC